MTYEETLDYMYSQLPMYQRQGKSAFKKDLTNIISLTSALGNPESKFKSIHIGGTNGKGTTAHIVAAGIQAHGYKVGMYTSPHYLDFRERIKINGNFISKENVVKFICENKSILEEVKPSFFEMTVAMAFDYFAAQNVDVAIIEVGLGGRLDSTNIIFPLVSVITNISFDHQAMLGNSLQQIATEKAGIIKENIPVIIGESQHEVDSVFENTAISQGSKIFWADQNSNISKSEYGYSFSVNDILWLEKIESDLKSDVQIKNLNTALFTLFNLRQEFNLKPEQISDGIKHMSDLTYYIGRYQKLQNEPLTIADSAHNMAGVTALLANINSYKYKQLHIVIGMVNDKDIKNVLNLLPTEAIYYFSKANIIRGLDPKKLEKIASKYMLRGKTFPTVINAYKTALKNADKSDLVLVMGSIFVVAEVLA